MANKWKEPPVLIAAVAVVISGTSFFVNSKQTDRAREVAREANTQAVQISKQQDLLSARLAERDNRISIFSAASAQVPLLFTAGPEREGACRVVVALESMEIRMLPENLASDEGSNPPLVTGLIDEILEIFDEIRANQGIPNCFAGRRAVPERVDSQPKDPSPSEVSDRHVVFATYTATQCDLAETALRHIETALNNQLDDHINLRLHETRNNRIVVSHDLGGTSEDSRETAQHIVSTAQKIGEEAENRIGSGEETRADRENLRFLTGTFIFQPEGWTLLEDCPS